MSIQVSVTKFSTQGYLPFTRSPIAANCTRRGLGSILEIWVSALLCRRELRPCRIPGFRPSALFFVSSPDHLAAQLEIRRFLAWVQKKRTDLDAERRRSPLP